MGYFVASVVGLAFGAADQYLGSLWSFTHLGRWAATVSMMAAPWLLLPFVAGLTQERAGRAMAVGLVVTVAGLVGYFAMTCSPMESLPLRGFSRCFTTLVRSPYNPLWIAGGVVTGPLYGLLGQRWRVARSWVAAALVICALCLEPVGRLILGMLSPPPWVWWAEIAIGVGVAVSFSIAIATSRRARGASPHRVGS